MSQPTLERQLEKLFELVVTLTPQGFAQLRPSIVVSMYLVQKGFKHIQNTVKNAKNNPWHAIDILEAEKLFEQGFQRTIDEKIQSDFLDFVRNTEWYIKEYSFEEYAENIAFVDQIVEQLDRIMVSKAQ